MTEDAFASFLGLPEQDRRDAFAVAARRLDTVPGYVEKDFWVCLVLDARCSAIRTGSRRYCSCCGRCAGSGWSSAAVRMRRGGGHGEWRKTALFDRFVQFDPAVVGVGTVAVH